MAKIDGLKKNKVGYLKTQRKLWRDNPHEEYYI